MSPPPTSSITQLAESIAEYCAYQQRQATLNDEYTLQEHRIFALQQQLAQSKENLESQKKMTRLALERMVRFGNGILASETCSTGDVAVKSENTVESATPLPTDPSRGSESSLLFESDVSSPSRLSPSASACSVAGPSPSSREESLTSSSVSPPASTHGKRKRNDKDGDTTEEGEISDHSTAQILHRQIRNKRPSYPCGYFNSERGCHHTAERCWFPHRCTRCSCSTHGAYDCPALNRFSSYT